MIRIEPEYYFQTYVSNTLAGSGNQYRFESDGQPHTGRIWYRLTEGGTYEYSLLFGNVINGTFADGSVSRKNDVIGGWTIRKLELAIATSLDNEAPLSWQTVTFQGQPSFTFPEEPLLVAGDPLPLTAEAGDWLCVQITYEGTTLPNHEESIISGFLWEENGWVLSHRMPYPEMIGCSRKASFRIGYLGDSITQGIGTPVDSYHHWNAELSVKLGAGTENGLAFWNIGLGYGRAEDAASLGMWMEKALHNDLVVLCFGVNDLYHTDRSEEGIEDDLATIVRNLTRHGIKVVLQTLPPFDHTGDIIPRWQRINRYLTETLSQEADGFFDDVPILGEGPEHPEKSRYGGHPNEEGCQRWAEALYETVDWNRLLGLTDA